MYPSDGKAHRRRKPNTLGRDDRWERAANRPQTLRPNVRIGSKTEVPGFARYVRFTLSSRHRQPAPLVSFSDIPQYPPQVCSGTNSRYFVVIFYDRAAT